MLRIGTSGYSYSHWKDVFYPATLPASRWLEYYGKFFDTVELNVTFYRQVKKEVFASWYKRTPDNFLFALKGPRVITHLKRLKDCEDSLKIFFENALPLKEKMGVVLWQLPPSLEKDIILLEEFCRTLKEEDYGRYLHAFEFRHNSWFREKTYEVLKKFSAALCIAHSRRWPLEEVVTADFVYLRFHGGTVLYGSEYSDKELGIWAKKIRNWIGGQKKVFAYFNNDYQGFAVKNALRLKEILRMW
ncbi:MAG: DUF72 domain-containing protein [Caldiserica bacterium]|nr:DUF72 domain-containing protein [Caldisericota bacterium]